MAFVYVAVVIVASILAPNRLWRAPSWSIPNVCSSELYHFQLVANFVQVH